VLYHTIQYWQELVSDVLAGWSIPARRRGLCVLKEEGSSNMARWDRSAFTAVVKDPSLQQTPSAQLFPLTANPLCSLSHGLCCRSRAPPTNRKKGITPFLQEELLLSGRSTHAPSFAPGLRTPISPVFSHLGQPSTPKLATKKSRLRVEVRVEIYFPPSFLFLGVLLPTSFGSDRDNSARGRLQKLTCR
jgi:hypothetical protein